MTDEQAPTDAGKQWKSDRTTFQRVYDVISGVQEPASAAAIGERAHCSTNGARRALEQLVDMGVAERRDGRPATYGRNDAYFTWRRVESLAEEYSADELRQRVADLVAEDREFQEQYGVSTPDAIATDELSVEDQEEVEARWADRNEWRTVRRDVRVLRRAVRRAESNDGGAVRA